MTESKKETAAVETAVEEKKTKKTAKKPAEKKAPCKGVVVECSKLNLRQIGYPTGKVIATIPCGAKVTIDMEKSTTGFYHVTTEKGIAGFCKKEYISLSC